MRSPTLPPPSPAREMPDKSPFTSARNTGTPAALNISAMRRRVTVLPVPVAPAIRPWRLIILPVIFSAFLGCPTLRARTNSVICCSYESGIRKKGAIVAPKRGLVAPAAAMLFRLPARRFAHKASARQPERRWSRFCSRYMPAGNRFWGRASCRWCLPGLVRLSTG